MQLNVFHLFGKKNAKQQQINQIPEDDITLPASTVSSLINPHGGWEPVGFDANHNYVILSLKSGQLVTLTPQDLNERKLRAVIGSRFCDAQYRVTDPHTHKTVFDYRELIEDIVHACDQMGLVRAGNVVSTGLHKNGDDLVVHYGLSVRTASGEEIDTTPTRERVYVAGPEMDISPDTPCATAEEVQTYVGAMSTFGLSPADRCKLMGWWAATSYGVAVTCHAIACLSAEAASGKTTLLDLLSVLHGDQAVRREGIPTNAQVLYAMENRARTLYCDEVEARGGKRKDFDNLAELGRIGFTQSGGPRHARVVSGKTRLFNTPVGVLLAGIGLPELNRATDSRAVYFRLERPTMRRERHPLLDPRNRLEVQQLGQRMRQRLFKQWPLMNGCLEVFQNALLDVGHPARAAEKYATLLAGYWTLLRGEMPSSDDVIALLQHAELNIVAEEVVERDSERCLNRLLSGKVVIYADVVGQRLKTHVTVGEVIRSIITGPADDRVPLARQLEDFGIRVDWKEGKWKLAVCSSTDHQRLSTMFRGTDVALGGWKHALLRLPGATDTVQRIGVDRRAQRAVMFDVPAFLQQAASAPDFNFPGAAEAA